MEPQSDCQSDALVLSETGIQGSYRFYNSQPGANSSLGVILMGMRIAEIDEQTVTEQLGDMPIVALNNVGTHPLVCTDHIPVLFGIDLGGELGRINQVAEHHRELATFGFWRTRFGWWSFNQSSLVF